VPEIACPGYVEKKMTTNRSLLALFVALGLPQGHARATEPARPLYRDSSQPIEKRIEDLLARMTLEEKIGQMNMPCVYESGLGKTIPEKMEAVQKFASGHLIDKFGPGGGFFTLPNTILHEGPRQQAEFLNLLQKLVLNRTRLGIPLLETEEGTHGLMCPGATIFPEGPALGSTWNMELLGRVYAAAAREARAIGVHQIFTLVVEPIRDPRLGRNEEAFSEDPYLCSRIAETIARSAQGGDLTAGDKVVAGLCHYPGQSQPVSGLERGAMEISERALREVFLPPWQAGIRSGALGVMATYPAVDGVPTHASAKLLTRILREELGFDGLVLSEGGGIGTLVYEGLAPTQREAGALALAAGVDVGISFESGYMLDLLVSVREGKVPMSLVDRSVRRILKQKFRLGLFEKRMVDPQRAVQIVHQADHQELALRAAREAIVLLKNEQRLLPLSKSLRSLAVIGPNADDPRNQLGDYIPTTIPQDIVTVLEGIKEMVSPGTKVTYVKGCNVTGGRVSEITNAREAAANADAAIVVVGENERRAEGSAPTDGEGFDAATLELTGMQEELVKVVHGTGTPTIVVLVNGRPLAVRWIATHVPAILEAWLPGEQGGRAVAEVLFGDVNPSGKLPVTVPRHAGQLPVYYNFKNSKRYWLARGWGHAYVDMEPAPLYPFGFGLSYSSFEYSELGLSARRIAPSEGLEIQVQVKNTSDRKGRETVQLYIEDTLSSVATPVKQLRGFSKLALAPGESRTCFFRLTPDDLALYDKDLRRVVEPGQFRVMVGSSSEDIRLTDQFEVK
jgi:beta-glucosidase